MCKVSSGPTASERETNGFVWSSGADFSWISLALELLLRGNVFTLDPPPQLREACDIFSYAPEVLQNVCFQREQCREETTLNY